MSENTWFAGMVLCRKLFCTWSTFPDFDARIIPVVINQGIQNVLLIAIFHEKYSVDAFSIKVNVPCLHFNNPPVQPASVAIAHL